MQSDERMMPRNNFCCLIALLPVGVLQTYAAGCNAWQYINRQVFDTSRALHVFSCLEVLNSCM